MLLLCGAASDCAACNAGLREGMIERTDMAGAEGMHVERLI